MKEIIGMNQKCKIIGLTGNTGSGKSTVATILRAYSTYIVDCDFIAHDIIQKGKPAYDELIDFFGDTILDDERNINRKALGSIAFSDSEKVKVLNSITHKYIVKKIMLQIEKAKNKYSYILIDAPLLIEADLHKVVDEVWLLYADYDERLKRIIQRDGITIEQAKKRMDIQTEFNVLKKFAHKIIRNESDYDKLKSQIESILGEHNDSRN